MNRDEYLGHYQKRSNVESTFFIIKAKFGDSVRSKSPTAMVIEALCKVLRHNLCCLIQSTHELGIEEKFWRGDESAGVATAIGATPGDDIEAWVWV